jgi:RimJ/RimL family protein N-acetyltransferase
VTGDLEALLGYHSSPEVHRYLPMEAMDAANILERLTKGNWSRSTLEEEGQLVMLGVELAATSQLVGDVMLRWTSTKNRSGEIGYVFDPAHQGRGYATEAVLAVLRLAFEELGLHRVIARIDARNGPSIALSERLGLRREAHLIENDWVRGEWTDEVNFAMLENEWRLLQPGHAANGQS